MTDVHKSDSYKPKEVRSPEVLLRKKLRAQKNRLLRRVQTLRDPKAIADQRDAYENFCADELEKFDPALTMADFYPQGIIRDGELKFSNADLEAAQLEVPKENAEPICFYCGCDRDHDKGTACVRDLPRTDPRFVKWEEGFHLAKLGAPLDESSRKDRFVAAGYASYKRTR